MNARQAIDFARSHEARVVDFKFTDLFGAWHHFSGPIDLLSESLFEEGIGFDGSSIRGFQSIEASDMLLVPDPSTVVMDPFTEVATVSIVCNIEDPITREPYSRDPRYVARKAETYLRGSGFADAAYFGPEMEFHILNDARFDQGPNFGFFQLDSEEAFWNMGEDEGPNLAYKMRPKGGYFPVSPNDKFQDVRTEMMLTLLEAGIPVEVQHHEVGAAGQAEIDIKYDTLTKTADRVQLYKYIVKNVAHRNGLTVTFMPKPIFQDNGSGMHCHQSLWSGDTNLMYDERGYAMLSETALFYIGGLLKHAPALLAFAAPTTNSYRRLVPGYEAPINLVYSQRNRSACVRIPTYSKSPKARRIEFRAPDPSCNPYLTFAALLMAGMDGIQNRIVPPDPVDKDIYELPPDEKRGIATTPGDLTAALNALESDCEFLMKAGVFTPDLIETYIEYKRKHEADAIALRPHPYEFVLYYDC
ncbi:MAG: type I glutamate--ammonia ligase [Armatimonadetes bacterium]|nr:type I glutamate--ammonia ligase [Armatimonadota bacterium]